MDFRATVEAGARTSYVPHTPNSNLKCDHPRGIELKKSLCSVRRKRATVPNEKLAGAASQWLSLVSCGHNDPPSP